MNTKDMLAMLQKTTDFSRFMRRCESGFSEPQVSAVLCALSEKYGVDRARVIARSGVERGYAYQAFSGRRVPSRDKLICLAFGLGASLEDAQELLRAAEKRELYPKIRRDAAIIFCLQRKLPLSDCHALLASIAEEGLGV